MQQATIKQHNSTEAKQKRLLMSLWLSSGKAATQSFHEWNKQRVNTLVMSWFKS